MTYEEWKALERGGRTWKRLELGTYRGLYARLARQVDIFDHRGEKLGTVPEGTPVEVTGWWPASGMISVEELGAPRFLNVGKADLTGLRWPAKLRPDEVREKRLFDTLPNTSGGGRHQYPAPEEATEQSVA
jgi:hypothetical protein